MKTFFMVCAALLGTWFWRRPAERENTGWPEGIPVFAGGAAGASFRLSSGTSCLGGTVGIDREAALESARTAFASAGWRELPVRTADMLLFVRGEAVAAVLAESVSGGTRITAISAPEAFKRGVAVRNRQ